MTYTIKDVCEKLNLTPHTVRHYCDNGLVPNLRRDAAGNRIFDEESLNWLQAAVFLRAAGMPVHEVRCYFLLCQKGEEALPERVKILESLQKQAETEMRQAQARFECLTRKLAHCRDIMDGKCPDDCNPMNW